MKLHHLSILLLLAVLLLVASSVEAGRRRRQLSASPTVYRAHFNRPLFTRYSIGQPFGQPVRYRAYIRDTADLSTLRYRVRIPRRPEVINAGRPIAHHNSRRYMKFDYEHPDHYHIYHS